MTWIVQLHESAARQLSGIPPDRRYRIIFKPNHGARVVEVLAILLRSESTCR